MSWLRQQLRSTTILFVLLAASALGCGSDDSRGDPSPTSPTSTSSSGQGGSRTGSSVKVTGVVAGLSGSCPNLSFMVVGMRVVTDSSTQFERIACTALRNGLQVEVQGVTRNDGAVMAREVELENEELEERPEARVEGTIGALSGSCPNLSFAIGSQRVITDAATRFKDASCIQFVNGTRARAKGTQQSNGNILARELELRRN
jgi:uncharacterized protein DUF5666